MDWFSALISAVLFAAAVPGVVVTLPSRSSPRNTILLVHALVFAVVTSVVMRFYWHNIRGYVETFATNFGDTCPNGFVMGSTESGINQSGCVPIGHATYPTDAAPKVKTA
jgi:thiamine transporter ThiT